MPRASVTAYFLFDVAEAIDLASVRSRIEPAVTIQLRTRPSIPPYVQYQQPPVALDGAAIGVAEGRQYAVRVKLFDYGVLSVALTRALPSDWDALVAEGIALQENPALEADAERLCRTVLGLIGPAAVHPRAEFLIEDYVVFTVAPEGSTPTGEALLAAHGGSLAQLLRGEREPLSDEERDEVLRHRISYYATDMVIATWNSALVYDTEDGAQGAMEIVEFANSQLLEFRYYDRMVDAELARVYAGLQRRPGWSQWASRRYTRAARQVQAFVIDVNELADKTENALKLSGDVYAARLFNIVAARLGLDQWKANVRGKLKTLDDIYRFAVERTSIARAEFLELMIVLLIVLEIVLLLAGIA